MRPVLQCTACKSGTYADLAIGSLEGDRHILCTKIMSGRWEFSAELTLKWAAIVVEQRQIERARRSK